MSQKTYALVVAIAAFAGTVSSSQAASANPLHPSYFAAKAKAVKMVGESRSAYVHANNPLHPMFGRASDWQVAANGTGRLYMDSRNPLHPSFGWL
jgi:hypothetical protein